MSSKAVRCVYCKPTFSVHWTVDFKTKLQETDTLLYVLRTRIVQFDFSQRLPGCCVGPPLQPADEKIEAANASGRPYANECWKLLKRTRKS